MKRRNALATVGVLLSALPSFLSAKLELIRSEERNVLQGGWKDIRESFDYSDYDVVDEMGFGLLRKIDEFTMDHLVGTPIHSHKNMEILTILLEGELFHEDTLGHKGLINAGEIQLMSAGSGLKHAETNPSRFSKAKGFQIWLSPTSKDTPPHYQLKRFEANYFTDTLSVIFSSVPEMNGMKVRLNAVLYRAKSTREMSYECPLHTAKNGFYLHIVSGEVKCNEQILRSGDGLGISDVDAVLIHAGAESDFLLFDVPMEGSSN